MNIVEAPQYIKHERHGVGKFLKEDPTNRVFQYLYRFNDGTLKWISEQEIREHSIPLIVNPY